MKGSFILPVAQAKNLGVTVDSSLINIHTHILTFPTPNPTNLIFTICSESNRFSPLPLPKPPSHLASIIAMTSNEVSLLLYGNSEHCSSHREPRKSCESDHITFLLIVTNMSLRLKANASTVTPRLYGMRLPILIS